MPRRIQLSRRKGWRKPADAVVVSRPTKWGNPYTLDRYEIVDSHDRPERGPEAARVKREMAVRDYWMALHCDMLNVNVDDVRRELRGKDLACWCPLEHECHADVLLEVANEGTA